MIRGVISSVMWVGRATIFGVGLAVTLALMLGVATTALAAVPGDPFRLGRFNTINSLSTLAGSANNAMLRVDNNSAGTSATALDLQVEPGRAPMKVNSDKQVTNLNADELDGNTANDFYFFGEKVQDSFNADFATSAGEAQDAQVAADADKLDGLEPAEIGRELFAVVRSEGTLARGNGATASARISIGFYAVDLNRDVSGCAYVGTIGSTTPGTPVAGQIGAARSDVSTNEIYIKTFDTSGTLTDKPFHLAVLC